MGKELFKKKDEVERRAERVRAWVTADEKKKIEHAAAIRQMDVSEFVRRAALGRKADVDIETEIILKLSDIGRCIRAMHAAMIEHNIAPPEAELLTLIHAARAAIKRISK